MLFDNILQGAQAVLGLGRDIANVDIGNKNLQMQKDVLDYTKSTQATTWQREDSAVQRRVADLKAAGINPILAAGSAASTSAPVRVEAPHRENITGFDQALTAQAMMRQAADISQTVQQAKLTAVEVAKSKAELWRLNHDNAFYDRMNLVSTAPTLPKMIGTALDPNGVIRGAVDSVIQKVKSVFAKPKVMPSIGHGGGGGAAW